MGKKAFAATVVVVGLVAFAGYKIMHSPADIEPAAGEAGASGQPMPATVQTLVLQNVQSWHEFSGKLVAVDRVDIRPRVGGAIDKIYFEPGSIVEKDQPLFLIDPRPYKAELNKQAAAVATARAQAALATSEAARAERLIKDNAISQREYDERINASKVNQANIQSAEAALQQARLNLDYATIKAPITGRISRAEITEGNLVDPAQAQILAEIVSVDPIYADFEIDEQTYLKSVRQSSEEKLEQDEEVVVPVRLSLANDNVTYEGKIVSFDNKLDPTSGTIRARAIFVNKDQALVPGMFSKVILGSAETVPAVLISDRYVVTDQDKKVVYVVGKDNMVEYRLVKLGDMAGKLRIVEEGLQPGERIVVKGLQRIRPGMPVQPQEEQAEEETEKPATAPTPEQAQGQ
jgi:membrane fusion protein, multidrug efflux system